MEIKRTKIFDIDYRVYIAGILMPSQRVSITSAFNAPPTATISVPSYPELYGIGREDRIPVHIFVKESWFLNAPYILIFEGEITSFSYVSARRGREININAQSLLSILKDVNLHFLTTLDDMVRTHLIKGETSKGISQVSPGMIFPLSLFMKGIAEVDDSKIIQTPTEYLQNAYKFLQVTGSMDDANNSILAEFYSKYATQVKLLQRFVDLPFFDDASFWDADGDNAGIFPLIDGIQKNMALEQLMNASNHAAGMSRGPTRGSVFDIVNYVVSQMEYEFSFISAPTFIEGDEDAQRMVSTCLKPILYEAVPPACNLVYSPLVESIQTAENVYQVPTRIRMVDTKGHLAKLSYNNQGVLGAASTIDYWPTEEYEKTQPGYQESGNWYATEHLKNEEFTGTYMFETEAPVWMPYLGLSQGKVDRELKVRIMKHLLTLRKYEERRVRVDMAFNPYVTPGFPGVVYDADDHRFVFVGHVLSTEHMLSKQSCSTTMVMGFVRTVAEALEDPLKNSVPKINDVTLNTDKMSKIYDTVLGCQATSFKDVKAKADARTNDAQSDSASAYAAARRGVTTFDQYLTFMGLSVKDSITDEDGQIVPTVLAGDFVEKRQANVEADVLIQQWLESYGEDETPEEPDLKGIRWMLKAIADREFKNKIYG